MPLRGGALSIDKSSGCERPLYTAVQVAGGGELWKNGIN
jgi:hypothetical protein